MAGGLSNAEVADLYERYGHLVLRRCRALLRDDALADDAFQNAFIKLMRHGAGVREAASPLGFVYRAADRCCFDLLGKRSRRAEGELPPEIGGHHPDPRFEARDLVLSLLGRLKEKDRQVAVWFFLDGLSQGEIAQELGWSRQTVNKRVQVIRERAEKLTGRRVVA